MMSKWMSSWLAPRLRALRVASPPPYRGRSGRFRCAGAADPRHALAEAYWGRFCVAGVGWGSGRLFRGRGISYGYVDEKGGGALSLRRRIDCALSAFLSRGGRVSILRDGVVAAWGGGRAESRTARCRRRRRRWWQLVESSPGYQGSQDGTARRRASPFA